MGALHCQEIFRLAGAFQRLLPPAELPTPAEADPTGSESFYFHKRAVKDAELFVLKEDGLLAEANASKRSMESVYAPCYGHNWSLARWRYCLAAAKWGGTLRP
jgi:hypothetical protein